MSMTEEIIEGLKAALLPELLELKQGQAEIRADLKVTNSRLDLLEERYDDLRDQMNKRFEQIDKRFDDMKGDMDKRFEQIDKRFDDMKGDMDRRFEQVEKRFERAERQVQEVHEDIREVRSYVWTGGYERAKAERQSGVVRESPGTYDPQGKPTQG
jgi:DNA repair exonuclease SbcCD ATPase subunit